MLDIKFLRANPEIVKQNIKNKFQDSKLPLVDEVIELDLRNREIKQEVEALRAEKNKVSKQIGALMAQGKKEEAEEVKKRIAEDGQKIEQLSVEEKEVEEKIKRFKKPIKVAVMGCAVNGPGEAREADFGIAGGVGGGLVFRKGKVIRSVPENELIDALMEEIEKFETEGEN